MRFIRLLIVLVLSTIAGSRSAAAFQDGAVQMFGQLNKEVVAVGEPLVWEVQAYVRLGTHTAEQLEEAFEAVSTFREETDLEFVRAEPPVITYSWLGSERIARVTQRLVFRAHKSGRMRTPRISFAWMGETHVLDGVEIRAYELDRSFHSVARAVVPIVVERRDAGSGIDYTRTGSGFFIAHDALVTSFHVASEARRVFVILPNGTKAKTSRVWSVDPARDVVILHVDELLVRAAGIEPIKVASVGEIDEVALDDVVFTNGWPAGLRRSTAGVTYPSSRLGFDQVWISNNGVRPGDSGGPLLNRRGEAVGVVSLGTITDTGPDVLTDDICIAHDMRPAMGLMNLALRPSELKEVFGQRGFRERPYVQAFRLLAMILNGERFDQSLRDALSLFEGSVDARYADPGLHFMRGVLHRMLGTHSVANEAFAEALRLFEGFFPASYLLGLERLRRKRYDEAAHHFEKTLLFKPYEHLAQYGLARSRMGQHRYAEAADLLRQVLSYDPYFAPGLHDLGISYLALNNDKALLILINRLGHVSLVWQRELERVVANEMLHPRRLAELPRAVLKEAPSR